GFGAIPVRGVLLAISASPAIIVLVQTLEGISAAVVGVLLPLIAADLTRTTGRFNLCLGFLGLATGVGATLSTTFSGFIADASGPRTALLALAAVGITSVALVAALPETDPDKAASKVVAEANQR
ncbi:MAG: MFS transporter, partial [Acetobacteraceae bacterium]|nr:MFS transporter [Acetobacteraceae bacterium]